MAEIPNLVAIWDIDQILRDSTNDWPAINRFAHAIYHLTGHKIDEFPNQNLLDLESATDFTVADDLAEYALKNGWGQKYYNRLNFFGKNLDFIQRKSLDEALIIYADFYFYKFHKAGLAFEMSGARSILEHVVELGGINLESSGNSETVAHLKLRLLKFNELFKYKLVGRSSVAGDILSLKGFHGHEGARSSIINRTIDEANVEYGLNICPRARYFGDRPGDVIAAINAGLPIEQRLTRLNYLRFSQINYEKGVSIVFVNPVKIDELDEPYSKIIQAYIDIGKCLHVPSLEDEKVKPYLNGISAQ